MSKNTKVHNLAECVINNCKRKNCCAPCTKHYKFTYCDCECHKENKRSKI